MSDERHYHVRKNARYQGAGPDGSEVVVKTEDSTTYSTTNQKEQHLLEVTHGIKPHTPQSESKDEDSHPAEMETSTAV